MRIGFMMKYDRERIAFAKKWGFGCLELMADPGDGYFPGDGNWEAKADEAKAAFDEAGLRISCVAGFYVNHMDPAEERANFDRVRGTIALASRLGVGVAAGFSGRIVNQPLEASLPKFKQLWGEHAKVAEDQGIKIAFEHCPMGNVYPPSEGNNMMCHPEIWEKAFNEVPSAALGLEWDPSHLIGLFIDPIPTIRRFGPRIYHVHAKDAHLNRDLLAAHGVGYPGVIEGCFPGLGDTDWGNAIKELRRAGYSNDLNIEGWHDHVYAGEMEDDGLVIGLRHLEQWGSRE